MKHKTLRETIQDITEGKVNKNTRSRGEIEAHIEGSKSMMETLKALSNRPSLYPGLKAELTSQIEFWKNQIADAKKALKALSEGKEQDTYIDGYKTMIATLNQFLKTAKSAALKKEIENQIEFWKNKIKEI